MGRVVYSSAVWKKDRRIGEFGLAVRKFVPGEVVSWRDQLFDGVVLRGRVESVRDYMPVGLRVVTQAGRVVHVFLDDVILEQDVI